MVFAFGCEIYSKENKTYEVHSFLCFKSDSFGLLQSMLYGQLLIQKPNPSVYLRVGMSQNVSLFIKKNKSYSFIIIPCYSFFYFISRNSFVIFI